MNPTNYVKHGRNIIAIFDDTSERDTRDAFQAALAAAKGDVKSIAFWRRPIVSGPWDTVCLVGQVPKGVRTSEAA